MYLLRLLAHEFDEQNHIRRDPWNSQSPASSRADVNRVVEPTSSQGLSIFRDVLLSGFFSAHLQSKSDFLHLA